MLMLVFKNVKGRLLLFDMYKKILYQAICGFNRLVGLTPVARSAWKNTCEGVTRLFNETLLESCCLST